MERGEEVPEVTVFTIRETMSECPVTPTNKNKRKKRERKVNPK